MNNSLVKKYPGLVKPQMWRAFGAHVFTAFGVVFAMFALAAAGKQDFWHMFLWLGCALVIDGVDGCLARSAKVTQMLPRFSGETLDIVIDYVTYVFVPAYFIYIGGVVPNGLALFTASLMCFTSLYHFADANNKTRDYYFSGFPALWNVVLFYIIIAQTGEIVSFIIILTLCAATFLPVKIVHPIRVVKYRPLNLTVTAVACISSVVVLYYEFDTPIFVKIALYLVLVYFFVVGLIRTVRAKPDFL